MADAEVKTGRRISGVWLVPIVALLLGAWLVFWTFQNQGPRVTITFSNAAGLEAGKTKIRVRNVEVGLVETVHLAEDIESVVVTAQMNPVAKQLLREDSRFWVVRAQVGPGGISGLGTLLSGAFIELAPGEGAPGRLEFQGLEAMPQTPSGTPGLELTLTSDRAGSITTGDPILYRGYKVGQVESATFDVDSGKMRYRAFIEEPYDALVTTTTRFWNASGVTVTAGAEGLEVQTGSLQTILAGGATFGQPTGIPPGTPAEDGIEFPLFRDFDQVNERPFNHYVHLVARFESSVRGLRPGAPVEYRGVRTGEVERIMIEELVQAEEGPGAAIPVLIRLVPGFISLPDSPEGVERFSTTIREGVVAGLRASLATGNLLTGSLVVRFDFFEDLPIQSMGEFAGYPTVPTTTSGLEGITDRMTALLDRVNELPMERIAEDIDLTLVELQGTLAQAEATLAEARALVASQGIQSVPPALEETLVRLDRTLLSIQALAETLEQQPNTLVFPRDTEPDLVPPAGTQ